MERDLHLISEIGQAARAAFSQVFEEWNSEADWPLKRTIEAQIAAASLGYKPVYWDTWGERASALLLSQLRPALPSGTMLGADNTGLVVFQPNAARPILDSDAAFYRPHGESDLEAVLRVSRVGTNGELLGYGARSFDTPGAVAVRILNDNGDLFASFMSDPRVADWHARERLLDIATYIDADLIYTIG